MADSTGKKIKEAILGKDTVKVNGKTMKVVGGDVTTGALGVAKKVAEKAVAKNAVESFSYRASELSKAERAKIAAQNAAAKSAQSKNLDAVDRGAKAAQSRKFGEMAKEEHAHNLGVKKGLAAGVAAGAAAGAAGEYVVSKQGSQAGHHVTTTTPKKNAMNQSERDFEAMQKAKAKATKKTGVYPNTAN